MKTKASEELSRKSKVIMIRWEERARKEVASAYGAASLTLRDALPGHLEQLAEALSSCGEKTNVEIAKTTVNEKDVGKEHGKDRAKHSNYSIEEVILEYRIFRQTIIQALEEEVPLSGVERDIITDLLEQAVNDAATEFSHSVREINDHYTAVLTHDLRSPLSAAKISAQLMLRNPKDLKSHTRNTIRIIHNLERMNSMLENLLDVGKIRVGQGLPTTWAECGPSKLIQTVIEEMSIIYGPHFHHKSDLNLSVWWSCDLIVRAIENLVTNAVKYGEVKGRVEIGLKQIHDWVVISVHNQGNPIPEDEMEKLFHLYHRAKTAVESDKKGWGLGLTLVSGVVKAHHGRIEVNSSESEGTVFTMFLPIDCRVLPLQPGAKAAF